MADITISYNNNTIVEFSNSDTKILETEGTYLIDDITVEYTKPSLQAKTNIAPGTSSQTISPDAGYYGLSSVQINAMPSGTAGTPVATKGKLSNNSISVTPNVTNVTGYITGGVKTGTAVTITASELVSGTKTITASGTTDVTNYASASVAAGTAGTPVATLGTVSDNSVSVTPSVTNTTGYITGSTKTGTAVTVSASDLVSGTKTITSGGTTDVTNYANASVATGTAGTPTASKGTVSNNSVAVTPSVTNVTGYITGGTKTGTAVTVAASDLVSGTKTITASGTTDVTNYASASVAAMTLPTAASSTGTGTNKATIGRSTSAQYINIPVGYNDAAASYTISAVANGSATTPATTITVYPQFTVNESTGLIEVSVEATRSVTPTISAGYVSSGTAGTITVSGSNTEQLTVYDGSHHTGT